MSSRQERGSQARIVLLSTRQGRFVWCCRLLSKDRFDMFPHPSSRHGQQ